MAMRVTFTAEHSETNRVPLDEAVAVFVQAMRTRGYVGTAVVEWPEIVGTVTGPAEEPSSSPPAETSAHTFEYRGGGYYAIYVDGEEVGSARGKAAAEAWTP